MIAAGLTLVLTVIAVIHLYWGFGGVWPGVDEKSCARATAGFKDIETMAPLAACAAVAGALLVAVYIALALGGTVPAIIPTELLLLAGTGASFVFIIRGVAAYTPAWRRLTPEMPFARYDVRYYAPLCLLIGIGFAILTAQGLPA